MQARAWFGGPSVYWRYTNVAAVFLLLPAMMLASPGVVAQTKTVLQPGERVITPEKPPAIVGIGGAGGTPPAMHRRPRVRITVEDQERYMRVRPRDNRYEGENAKAPRVINLIKRRDKGTNREVK